MLVSNWSSGLSEAGGANAGRTEVARPEFRRVRPVWKASLLAFLTGVATGCYTYTPVLSTPTPGMELALELNDRGRVAMGERIGPAATRIEGALKADTDSAYQLSVSSVTYLRGQANKWNGEPLSVSKAFVRDSRQRQFSRSRTTLVTVLTVGGVLAFALTRHLIASGQNDREPGPGEPPLDH